MAAQERAKGVVALLVVPLVAAAAYVLSEGPAAYGLARGWVSPQVHDLLYAPLTVLLPEKIESAAERYPLWWYERGEQDAHGVKAP